MNDDTELGGEARGEVGAKDAARPEEEGGKRKDVLSYTNYQGQSSSGSHSSAVPVQPPGETGGGGEDGRELIATKQTAKGGAKAAQRAYHDERRELYDITWLSYSPAESCTANSYCTANSC